MRTYVLRISHVTLMAFNRETHKFYGEQNESEAKPKDNGLSNLSSSTASPVLNPTQKQLPAYNRFCIISTLKA